jgi:hypothetical protein
MEPLGWLMLLVSVGGVWALCIWCYVKVLTLPPTEKVPEPVKEFHSA